MGKLRALILTGLVLVVTFAGVPAGAAPGDHVAQTVTAAAGPATDTPSPTLGSTPQPGVNPPGVNDADPKDFDRVPLVVISFIFLAALVGGSLLFYLWRRSRQTREPVRRRRDTAAPPE
jgi:hypothetical protein